MAKHDRVTVYAGDPIKRFTLEARRAGGKVTVEDVAGEVIVQEWGAGRADQPIRELRVNGDDVMAVLRDSVKDERPA